MTGSMILCPAFDVSDDRLLVGFADDVFVGRVLEAEDGVASAGDASPASSPRSRFSVAVLENVKGRLAGAVTVVQDGGWAEYRANRDYPEHGVRRGEPIRELVIANGDPLLEPGEEVLFVTRRDREGRQQRVAWPGSGDVRVRDGAHREALVRRFRQAMKDQIDPPR